MRLDVPKMMFKKKKTPNQTKAKHYCTRSRERKFPFHTESLPNAILQGAKMAQTCLSLHFFFLYQMAGL